MRRAADSNHFLGLCSVFETWVAAYVLWVLRGGFLITVCTLLNWRLDFLKRKGNYASQSTLAYLCMNVYLCVWVHVASSLNLNRRNDCIITQDTAGDWFVKELRGVFCAVLTWRNRWIIIIIVRWWLQIVQCLRVYGVFANEFGQVNHEL